MEEDWADIPEFPDYAVSNFGKVFNFRKDKLMALSNTNHGHVKVTLTIHGRRYTRSVAVLVAQAFVPALNPLCDAVIILNGNLNDLRAFNLAWRPTWFAWKYTRQLKQELPIYYYNLKILNETTGQVYNSVIDAGMEEGLLFDDIWRSTYRGDIVYPTNYTFLVVKEYGVVA